MEFNIEEVMSWETKQLWNAVSSIKEETDDFDEDIDKIKNGFNIKVPIWYFAEEWFELYPNSKKAKIQGYPKITINEFMEEKEKRESVMRKIIIEYNEVEGIIEER